MSVAGIMMVRDEVDIIEASVRHLAANVGRVYVADNGSTDGTLEVLGQLKEELSVVLWLDRERGYYQSRKMTAMAQEAARRGYTWVVPCDADELWYGPEGMTVSAFLEQQGPDVQVVTAELFDYMPPSTGLNGGHPFAAINWRRAVPGALPKVACRTHPSLVIEAGNHGARYGDGRVLKVPGLTIRHFTWRSPEQYLRKIRNGLEAYGATDIDPAFGAHWRMFDGADDETILAHYETWFAVDDPEGDPLDLVYDPAVVAA